MFASIHSPKTVKVRELSNSSAVTISLQDEKGNDATIFFDDYDAFLNFATIIRKGGTNGVEYNLEHFNAKSNA